MYRAKRSRACPAGIPVSSPHRMGVPRSGKVSGFRSGAPGCSPNTRSGRSCAHSLPQRMPGGRILRQISGPCTVHPLRYAGDVSSHSSAPRFRPFCTGRQSISPVHWPRCSGVYGRLILRHLRPHLPKRNGFPFSFFVSIMRFVLCIS